MISTGLRAAFCSFCSFCFATLLLLADGAAAEGDADKGRKLAEQFCTRCHNIEPDGPYKLHPPSFASIAVFRAPHQIWERIALPSLHSGMWGADRYMETSSLDDLVAYIVSLEAR